jgi:hypothetical protein
MLVLGAATVCCEFLAGTFCCRIVETEELEVNRNTKIVIVKAKKIFGKQTLEFLRPVLYHFHIRVSNEARTILNLPPK